MPLLEDGTTYVKTQVDDPKRAVEIEVGDSKQADFLPQFKTLHWGNEANFSVRLVDDAVALAADVAATADAVEWRKGDRTARFYEVDGFEDGGFEFEVELASPPASNVLRFTIQTKELVFYYQGELDPNDPEDAVSERPENVVGSYAVYHASRAGNFDDKHYRAGKAFHIYRPHAVDAKGRQTWCELFIDADAGVMTITVPQKFLDTAVYPVIVDPTFGYTTAGGTATSVSSSSVAVGSLYGTYAAVTGDNITQFSIYGDTNSAGDNGCYMAAYTIDATPLPVSRLALGVFVAVVSTTAVWNDSAIISQAMSNGITYDVAFGENLWAFAWRVYRDGGAGTNRSANANFTLDATWSSTLTSSVIYSMYATYAGVAGAPPGLPIPTNVMRFVEVRPH